MKKKSITMKETTLLASVKKTSTDLFKSDTIVLRWRRIGTSSRLRFRNSKTMSLT
jgi:hypothetical protein